MAWIGETDVWLSESESLQNAQYAANVCMSLGWKKEAVCALLGNMRHESSINPNIWEYGYYHSIYRGYGLVQWTPATKLIDWCSANGLTYTDGDAQMARINYETEQNIQWGPKIYGTPPYNFRAFTQNQNNDSIATLTEYFVKFYEAPGNLDSLPSRIAFANLCNTSLTFEGGNGGTTIKPLKPVYPETPITSPFGYRDIGIGTNDHLGTDFGGSSGDPIFATMNGTVVKSTFDSSRGNYVIIQHSQDSYYSTYQHNLSNSVSVGQVVQQGDTIALMGTTGDSTGVHLHFAISTTPYGSYADDGQVGVFIDPETYLASEITIGGGGTDPEPPSKTKALIHLLISNQLFGAW